MAKAGAAHRQSSKTTGAYRHRLVGLAGRVLILVTGQPDPVGADYKSFGAEFSKYYFQRFQSQTGPSAKHARDSDITGSEQPASSRRARAQFNAGTLEHVFFFC